MNKKTLGVILVASVVVIAGIVYFGFQKGLFTEKGIGIGGIGKKSLMDRYGEQGQLVPSKSEAIKECEKETDQDEKNTCYGLMAFYYRDASFCKEVGDPEIKKNCNQENIEKWYSEIEKGGAMSSFMPGLAVPAGGTFPTEGIIPGGESVSPETETENQEKPIVSGKMTDAIYIEILAQTGYYAQKDPSNFASHMAGFYEKYGVTEEDLNTYGEELEKDPQRGGVLWSKIAERMQELQATGE